jgi:peroxiredoxin
MKKTILTYSVFSVLVFLNLYLLWRYRELSIQVQEYNMAVRPIEEQIQRIEKSFIGRKVENFALKDRTNSTTFLYTLLHKREFTVFAVFTGTICTRCFSLEIPKLSSLSKKLSKDSAQLVLALSSDQLPLLQQFRRVYPLNCEVLFDDTATINSAWGLSKTPFVSLINSRGKILHFYISDYNNEERSQSFFQQLEKLVG